MSQPTSRRRGPATTAVAVASECASCLDEPADNLRQADVETGDDGEEGDDGGAEEAREERHHTTERTRGERRAGTKADARAASTAGVFSPAIRAAARAAEFTRVAATGLARGAKHATKPSRQRLLRSWRQRGSCRHGSNAAAAATDADSHATRPSSPPPPPPMPSRADAAAASSNQRAPVARVPVRPAARSFYRLRSTTRRALSSPSNAHARATRAALRRLHVCRWPPPFSSWLRRRRLRAPPLRPRRAHRRSPPGGGRVARSHRSLTTGMDRVTGAARVHHSVSTHQCANVRRDAAGIRASTRQQTLA